MRNTILYKLNKEIEDAKVEAKSHYRLAQEEFLKDLVGEEWDQVFELGTEGSRQFCEKYGFKFVPIFFEGTIEEFLKKNLDKSYGPDDDSWKEDFVNEVKKHFNEKDCFMCENKLPEEGVVIVKQRLDKFEAYKQKSHRFLKAEVDEVEDSEVEEYITSRDKPKDGGPKYYTLRLDRLKNVIQKGNKQNAAS